MATGRPSGCPIPCSRLPGEREQAPLKIAFHGAAGGVTGSRHRIECRGTQVRVDRGLYQGGQELEEESADPFGFDPARVFGDEIPVRARIHTLNGFSAHDDQAELLTQHRGAAPATTFRVHGDEEASAAFARLLPTGRAERPELHAAFAL